MRKRMNLYTSVSMGKQRYENAGAQTGRLEGRPRGRAAPANLSADPCAEVWGVLYRITRRDLVRLDATEGIPWSRYRPLWLTTEDISGNTLLAATYIAQGNKDDGNPSLRYITLL